MTLKTRKRLAVPASATPAMSPMLASVRAVPIPIDTIAGTPAIRTPVSPMTAVEEPSRRPTTRVLSVIAKALIIWAPIARKIAPAQ